MTMSVRAQRWMMRDRELAFDRPLIMGILNVTPDSFSDGGRYLAPDHAVARGLELAEQGAAIIDVGGESTRPGAVPVSAEEEERRVVPVIQALVRSTSAAISVDTTKASVAEAALRAGAHIVNDVSAGLADTGMLAVVHRAGAGLILMHRQGTPATMQVNPSYENVVDEVGHFLLQRIQAAVAFGVALDHIVVDPGIGFGKTVEHNLSLLKHLGQIADLTGRPVLVGVSRKRFIGAVTGKDTGDRLAGSLAAMAFAIQQGARIIRVHDVKESCDVAAMMARLGSTEDDR